MKSDFRSAAGDHPPAVPAPKVSPSAAAMLGASPKKAETLLVDFGRKLLGFLPCQGEMLAAREGWTSAKCFSCPAEPAVLRE